MKLYSKATKDQIKEAIETIFKVPLSDFEKFSILECEYEDYFNILIHDTFIWKELLKNKGTKLKNFIQEILENDNNDLFTMTNKIEFFTNYQIQQLKIAEIGQSQDERFPEDAKPITEIKCEFKGFYDSLNTILNETENNIYFQVTEGETGNIEIDENYNKDKNYTNINMIRFNGNNINKIDNATFKNAIITSNKINTINSINLNEVNKLKEISNINKIINKDNFEKKLTFNKRPSTHSSLLQNNIPEPNINNINNDKPNKINILNKEKIFKNPEHLLFKNKNT